MRFREAALVVALVALAAPAPMQAASSGEELFVANRCNLCHAVEAAGIEAKAKSEKVRGPALPNGTQDRQLLASYLRQEQELSGARHKKRFAGSAEELAALVGWLTGLSSAP